jgi:nicotinamide mononucleotide adenylyltransferase
MSLTQKLLPLEAIDTDAVPVIIATCGSYNPIHTAHVQMFEAAKASIERPDASGAPARMHAGLAGKKTVVVGGFLSPVADAYKKPGLAPFAARRAICDAALSENEWIACSPWEGEQPAYTRSYHVLKRILSDVQVHYGSLGPAGAALAPRIQLCFLCGGDLFETFYRPGVWDLALLRSIFEEMWMLVVCRDGSVAPHDVMAGAQLLTHASAPGVELDVKPYADRVAVVTIAPNVTSSTLVRTRLAAGESIEGLVPAACIAVLTSGGAYPTKSD